MSGCKIISGEEVQAKAMPLLDFQDPSKTITATPEEPSGFQTRIPAAASTTEEQAAPAEEEAKDGSPDKGSTETGPSTEEAYAKGYEEGKQAMAGELETAVQSLLAITQEFSSLRTQMVQTNAKDMVRLSMTIAETIIQKAVSQDHEIVLNVVQKALQAGLDGEEYIVYVNPKDLDIVQQQRPLLVAGIMEVKGITIKPNPGITEGGCTIESSLGQVDATIESQLEEIRQKILDNLDNI